MRRRISSGWDLQVLQQQLDELFDLLTASADPGAVWSPPVDLLDFPDRFVLRVDLPAVDPGDCRIELCGDRLRIEGGKRAPRSNLEERHYHRMERGFGSFSVEVSVPGPVRPADCRAVLRRGVLEVTLPRLADRRRSVFGIPISEEEP